MASQKPENSFISAVHKRFIVKPHYEKMNNPFRAGGADMWYTGEVGDLWVEYKYIKRIPITADTIPDCSPLQLRWLANRHDEGRNVAVILGTPLGGVIYRDRAWLIPLSPVELHAKMKTKDQLAEWISNHTGAGKCYTLQ